LSAAELRFGRDRHKFPCNDRPAGSARGAAAISEVIIFIFPRTNIRVPRRRWGLPEFGPLIAGPDARPVTEFASDAPVDWTIPSNRR
jgi:hypothetical protein